MDELHTETRGQFRWLETTGYDDDLTIRTARAELPSGLVVERAVVCKRGDATPSRVVFVSDDSGTEITISQQQSAELRMALGEMPAT